jgi:ribosomal protein L37AE/L43A
MSTHFRTSETPSRFQPNRSSQTAQPKFYIISMSMSSECPYCASRLLQHIRQSKAYWFCHRCFEEVPYGIDRTADGVQLQWVLPKPKPVKAIDPPTLPLLPVGDSPLVELQPYCEWIVPDLAPVKS